MSEPPGQVATTSHMSLSVRGFLHQGDAEHHRALSWITKPSGEPYRDAYELREAMFEKLATGWEQLPFGDCDDFDPKTGCRGHAQAAADSSGPQEGGERD